MRVSLRDFAISDAATIDRLAVASFSQYSRDFQDWPAMVRVLEKMSAMAASAEIIIAEHEGRVIGADPDARVRFELQRDATIYSGNN